MGKDPDSTKISDEKAALVLERAAKLDAGRGRWLEIADLREAALEAGISLDAFERALAEIAARTSPESEPKARPPTLHATVSSVEGTGPTSSFNLWAGRAGVLGAGLFLGGFTTFLWRGLGLGDAGIVFGLLLALQFLLALLFRRRRDRDIVEFEIDLGLLWAGLTFTLMIGDPNSAEEALAYMATFWAAAAVAGAGIIVLPRAGKKPEELPEET